MAKTTTAFTVRMYMYVDELIHMLGELKDDSRCDVQDSIVGLTRCTVAGMVVITVFFSEVQVLKGLGS